MVPIELGGDFFLLKNRIVGFAIFFCTHAKASGYKKGTFVFILKTNGPPLGAYPMPPIRPCIYSYRLVSNEIRSMLSDFRVLRHLDSITLRSYGEKHQPSSAQFYFFPPGKNPQDPIFFWLLGAKKCIFLCIGLSVPTTPDIFF